MKLPKIPYLFLLIAPYIMFAVGFALNVACMNANDQHMIVNAPNCEESDFEESPIHACMKKNSRLKILGDWILIRGDGIYSIGDGLETAYDVTQAPFLFLWVVLMIRDRDRGETWKS